MNLELILLLFIKSCVARSIEHSYDGKVFGQKLYICYAQKKFQVNI